MADFLRSTAQFLLSQLAPSAYANCDVSQAGVSLGDCFTLGVGGETVSSVYDTPATLVNLIVSNIFILSGIILFFTIAFAGFKFIEAGEKGKEEAKTIINVAIKGLIVMFIAYWIVQIIQVITGMNLLSQ